MKKYIFCWFLCLTALTAKTQFLTESATGNGAVILPLNGVAVGFDIGKTEIAVGVNNYSEALNRSNDKAFKNWFLGANLTLKNTSGIGNLFQAGDIVPAGNFLGFLGFNLNNNQSILDAWNASGTVPALSRLEQKRLKELFLSYRADVANFIEVSLVMIKDEALRERKGREFIKIVTEESPDPGALRRGMATILADKEEGLKPFLLTLRLLLEPREKDFIASFSRDEATKAVDAAFNTFVDDQVVIRITPFLFGGIEARNFSSYSELNPSSLTNSFQNTLYRGGLIGGGVNAQYGSFWLGITYAYLDGDNFSNLTSKEYTLRTTEIAGNQSLISEKKITAYSGKYAKVESNQLNVDLLKEFSFGDTSRMIMDLYYRGSLNSRDTSYLKNISNLGLGLYFLGEKSKFLGGLYVELPDINNNIEKAKPESERSIRPPMKKLSFGVVTIFTIDSVIGFVNRPRKPD